jgi:hypothetical protein
MIAYMVPPGGVDIVLLSTTTQVNGLAEEKKFWRSHNE